MDIGEVMNTQFDFRLDRHSLRAGHWSYTLGPVNDTD